MVLFPDWLFTYRGLSADEKILYLKIVDLAGDNGTNISNVDLADVIGKDYRTVKRYLTNIENKGLIKRVTTQKYGYIKQRTIYVTKINSL